MKNTSRLPLLLKNGKPCSLEKASNAISENQLSVFESMIVYNGVIFELEEHLSRFYASAKTVGLKIKATQKDLSRELYSALRASGRQNVSLRLMADGRDVFIMVRDKKIYPESIFSDGVRLRSSSFIKNSAQSMFPEAKSSNYLNQIMASPELGSRDVFELLFIDRLGFVKEARVCNIFIVKDGEVLTPMSQGIIEMRETQLMRYDVFTSDEAFLTVTSAEIIPVREVDGRKIGAKVPGRITAILKKEFPKKVREYINSNRQKKG
jgi:branched-chain amino acid aminotransferase